MIVARHTFDAGSKVASMVRSRSPFVGHAGTESIFGNRQPCKFIFKRTHASTVYSWVLMFAAGPPTDDPDPTGDQDEHAVGEGVTDSITVM